MLLSVSTKGDNFPVRQTYPFNTSNYSYILIWGTVAAHLHPLSQVLALWYLIRLHPFGKSSIR